MKISVAFYKKDAPKATIYDKLVAWWTNSDVCHTEIIIDGEQYSSSPRDGGVRRVPHKVDHQTWEYLEIEINERDLVRGLTFFEKTKYRDYDWMGIFGFISPFKDKENAYFCSEWCSKFLIIVGVSKLFDKEPYKISPARLKAILLDQPYCGNVLKCFFKKSVEKMVEIWKRVISLIGL